MDKKEKPAQHAIDRIKQALFLHTFVIAVWLLFNVFRLLDKRFATAIRSFSATYHFCTPLCVRSLVFDCGRIKTRRGKSPSPDFEILILDPLGVLVSMSNNPDDLYTLVMENKINQSGNLFFLYKFGFLAGLCNRRFQDITKKFGFLERGSRPYGKLT